MKSPGSTGDMSEGVSEGVGGNEIAAAAGVGREGLGVGGAIGRVRERRFGFREADDAERVERVSERSSRDGVGGVDSMSSATFLASVPTRGRPPPRRACGAGAGDGASSNMACSKP